jgi:hypothetical protein
VFGCNKLYSFEYHGIAKTVVFSEFLNSTLGLFFFLNHGFAHQWVLKLKFLSFVFQKKNYSFYTKHLFGCCSIKKP